MNKREKMLAGVVAALVALFGISYYYGEFTHAVRFRESAVTAAKAKLEEANKRLKAGLKAADQMDAWQQRALPANIETAKLLYRSWLLTKATESGLTPKTVSPLQTTVVTNAYTPIGYRIVGTGSLSAVAKMLYEIYHSPQLQQIDRLQLTRPAGAPDLSVTLEVEALSMRGAQAKDKLPEGDSKRLKLASADAYVKTLVERDLAAAYMPPRPPAPPPREQRREVVRKPDKFDDSEQARFSGSVNNGKEFEAWISVRSTGELLKLVAGDPVKIGALDGKIESVDGLSLVLNTGKKRFRVKLGEFLRKGTEIATDGSPKKAKPPATPES